MVVVVHQRIEIGEERIEKHGPFVGFENEQRFRSPRDGGDDAECAETDQRGMKQLCSVLLGALHDRAVGEDELEAGHLLGQ